MNKEKKIEIPTTMICSVSHSYEAKCNRYDGILNPEYMINDVSKIVNFLNIKQYETGHDIMLKFSNDGDNFDWKHFLKIMIEE